MAAVRAEGHAVDQVGMTDEGADFLAAVHVPDLHLAGALMNAAARNQAVAVGTERHALNRAGMSADDPDLPAGLSVPDARCLVRAAAGKQTPVGAVSQAFDSLGVADQFS